MAIVSINGVSGASFFDSEKVLKALEKGEQKALSKCGSFVRTVAKSSLRYATKKKKGSQPGSPPVVHRRSSMKRTSTNKKTGVQKTRYTSPLKELIYFAYDPSTKSVVIGPAIFREARSKSYKVPTVLEKGGTISFISNGKVAVTRMSARPFMMPALTQTLPKFQATFKNIMG